MWLDTFFIANITPPAVNKYAESQTNPQMVWRLHRELGIPAESLIKQDERRKAA